MIVTGEEYLDYQAIAEICFSFFKKKSLGLKIPHAYGFLFGPEGFGYYIFMLLPNN